MPYIDNVEQLDYKLYDKTAMEDFGKILEMNGWTKVKHFYKVVIGRKQFRYPGVHEGTNVSADYIPYIHASAHHVLYQNAKGKILGMAEILTDSYKILPTAIYKGDRSTGGTNANGEMDEFIENFPRIFDNNKVKGLIYFYTVENTPEIRDGAVSITYPLTSLTDEIHYSTALDVEVGELCMYPVSFVATGETSYTHLFQKSANDAGIREKVNPRVMQSTIVPVELFNSVTEEDSVDNVYSALNKWDDSSITVKGRIDGNNIIVMLQSDTSANWSNNKYPIVPLFFGEVEMENGEEDVYCLFGGVTPPTATYDFSSLTKYAGNVKTKLVIPTLKAYPSYPGDGINNAVLSRTRGGARYQAVYLSWGASPNSMPPVKEGTGGKKYPGAWDFKVKNFGFNPSRYSNSIHTSHIYIVHPEDGVIGKLRNIVGLQTFATNNPELRILREDCPVKVTDAYQVFTVGAICPFTKTPSTTYALAGIAIKDTVVEKANYTTVPVPQNVKAKVDGTVLTVTWDIVGDHFHEGVRIDVDGIEIAHIVSGTKQYKVDLTYLDITLPVGSVGVTSVNHRGQESDTVEVTL